LVRRNGAMRIPSPLRGRAKSLGRWILAFRLVWRLWRLSFSWVWPAPRATPIHFASSPDTPGATCGCCRDSPRRRAPRAFFTDTLKDSSCSFYNRIKQVWMGVRDRVNSDLWRTEALLAVGVGAASSGDGGFISILTLGAGRPYPLAPLFP